MEQLIFWEANSTYVDSVQDPNRHFRVYLQESWIFGSWVHNVFNSIIGSTLKSFENNTTITALKYFLDYTLIRDYYIESDFKYFTSEFVLMAVKHYLMYIFLLGRVILFILILVGFLKSSAGRVHPIIKITVIIIKFKNYNAEKLSIYKSLISVYSIP